MRFFIVDTRIVGAASPVLRQQRRQGSSLFTAQRRFDRRQPSEQPLLYIKMVQFDLLILSVLMKQGRAFAQIGAQDFVVAVTTARACGGGGAGRYEL
jgi:hypothetical protein